jgi:HNH endonuclease
MTTLSADAKAMLAQSRAMLRALQGDRDAALRQSRALKGLGGDRAAEVGEKRARSFYNSWGWKALRYRVLKERGRACECCRSSAAEGAKIVVDHIRPVRMFWHLRLDPQNLQVLCDDCNRGKGWRDVTDWRCPEAAA